MPFMKPILILSQSAITLKNLPLEFLNKLEGVLQSLVQPQLKPNTSSKFNKFAKVTEPKLFAVAKNSPIGIKLHRNLYDKLLSLFERFLGTDVSKTAQLEETYTPATINVDIREGWNFRDYQVPVCEFLTDEGVNKRVHSPLLISLPTGYGKTSTSLMAASKLNIRIGVLLAPNMIPQWLDNIYKILTVDKKEALVISGSSSLKGLQALAHEGKLTEKVIVFSNKTIQNYLAEYEAAEGDYEGIGYYYPPEKLMQALGIGVLIVDEIHMSWHFNFKMMLYTTVKHYWALSASLINNDRFLEKTYNIAFPTETRYVQEVTNKYINGIAIAYCFENPATVRYTVRNSTFYNQIAFEQSILRDQKRKVNWLNMVVECINMGYLSSTYQKGDRCAWYFQSIDMCTEVAAHLKKAYPNLSVERFVSDDHEDNLYLPDIRVTSNQMAGTGKDISNLVWVYNAIAMDSAQAHKQNPGRLREIKDREVTYVTLYNRQNPKHLNYQKNRRLSFLSYLGKNYKEFNYPNFL